MAKTDAETASTENQTFEEFQIGDQVKHPKWGVGAILFRKGSGESTKVIVIFPDEGQKKLALKYAKLKKVQPARPGPVAQEEPEEAEKPDEEAAEQIEEMGKSNEEEILSPADLEEQVAFGDDDDESKIKNLSKKDDDPVGE
jgi:hypothetical protein